MMIFVFMASPNFVFSLANPAFTICHGFAKLFNRKERNAAEPQPKPMDCGGKQSATPLWELCSLLKSGVAAALCHHSPKIFAARDEAGEWQCKEASAHSAAKPTFGARPSGGFMVVAPMPWGCEETLALREVKRHECRAPFFALLPCSASVRLHFIFALFAVKSPAGIPRHARS
jgi:hypothetical protein